VKGGTLKVFLCGVGWGWMGGRGGCFVWHLGVHGGGCLVGVVVWGGGFNCGGGVVCVFVCC